MNTLNNTDGVEVGFSRSWREKKSAKKSQQKFANFVGEKKLQILRFWPLSKKKKSQVIFLASQFFFLAGIRLFWLS